MFKNKRFYLAIFAILIIILSSQVVFALENDTDTSIEDNQFIGSDNDLIDDDIVVEDCTESGGHTSDGLNSDNLLESTSENTVSSQKNYTLFFISDNPGTNILDAASQELFNGSDFKDVNIIVRSGEQIKTMDELELVNLLLPKEVMKLK